MAWIFDEFAKHKGFNPGVVTGKVVLLERRSAEECGRPLWPCV